MGGKLNYLDYIKQGLLGILIFLSLIIFPVEWVTHAHYFITIAVGLIILILSIINWEEKISISLFDLVFIGFVGLNFCSYFWANNPDITLAPSIGWLTVFCIYKSIQSFEFSDKHLNLGLKLTCAILGVSLFAVFYIIFENEQFLTKGTLVKKSSAINRALGVNGNYVCATLVLFLPILLLSYQRLSNWIWKFLIAIFTLSILYLCLIFNCRGAILVIMVQFLFLIKNGSKKLIISSVAILGIASLLIFFSIGSDKNRYLNNLNPFKDTLSEKGDDRIRIWKNTFKITKEAPLLGVGNGNWLLHSLESGQGTYITYFNKNGFYLHPHNQNLHIASELGLIGILFYFAILLLICKRMYHFSQEKRDPFLSSTLLAIIVSYFILSNFYGVIYSVNGTLKIPQTLLFIVAGLLFNRNKSALFSGRQLLVSALIIGPIIFNIQALNFEKEYENFLAYKASKKYQQALDKLDSLPLLNLANFKYPMSRRVEKAGILLELGRKEDAIKEIKISLDQFPYFADWIQLARIYEKEDLQKAKFAYEKAYELNPTFLQIHFALAFIAISEKNLPLAEKYLEYYYSLGISEEDLKKSKEMGIVFSDRKSKEKNPEMARYIRAKYQQKFTYFKKYKKVVEKIERQLEVAKQQQEKNIKSKE